MTSVAAGAPAHGLGPEDGELDLDPDLVATVRRMVEHRAGELVYMRRWLHARPEVSRAEHETTATLRERLKVEGLAPTVLDAGTGVVCDVGHAGPLVALRADIDALAMQDVKDVPYRSMNKGACHACGHDVHTTVVLGAGLILRELLMSGRAPGRVRLIFEPSEESFPGGALDVIAEGWMQDVTGIFGLHCDPKLDVGHLGCRRGALTSASDYLGISLHGPGGHTARPGLTVNLVDVVAQLVRELPSAVQAGVDAHRLPDSAVVAEGLDELRLVFGAVHTGSAANVIPAEAMVEGSLRTPWPAVSETFTTVVPRAIAGVLGTDLRPEADGHVGARGDGLRWHLRHHRGVTAVINDPAATRLVARAARTVGGPDAVRDTPHSWGGDTFGWYLDHVPGCYARLGTRPLGAHELLDLHRPNFDIDESAILFGTRVLVLTALAWLANESAR